MSGFKTITIPERLIGPLDAALRTAEDTWEQDKRTYAKTGQHKVADHFATLLGDVLVLQDCVADAKGAVSIALVALVNDMLSYEGEAFDADEEVDGADLLERFAEWRPLLRAAIAGEAT